MLRRPNSQIPPYTAICGEFHPFIAIMYGGQSFTHQAILDELCTHIDDEDRGERESNSSRLRERERNVIKEKNIHYFNQR